MEKGSGMCAFGSQTKKKPLNVFFPRMLFLGAKTAGAGSSVAVTSSKDGKGGVKTIDYQKVYNAIADLLEDDNYDDGSYGPVFLRLAWHASGTWDQAAKTGGSSKGTMRFKSESSHSANAGLGIARERLNRVKDKFPDISYGDLWTLAGVCAIQEMVRSEGRGG
jgi:cytochrome c peroxidase